MGMIFAATVWVLVVWPGTPTDLHFADKQSCEQVSCAIYKKSDFNSDTFCVQANNLTSVPSSQVTPPSNAADNTR
jgi:hypothetical protein